MTNRDVGNTRGLTLVKIIKAIFSLPLVLLNVGGLMFALYLMPSGYMVNAQSPFSIWLLVFVVHATGWALVEYGKIFSDL